MVNLGHFVSGPAQQRNRGSEYIIRINMIYVSISFICVPWRGGAGELGPVCGTRFRPSFFVHGQRGPPP